MFRIISYMLICTILPKRFVLCVVSKKPRAELTYKSYAKVQPYRTKHHVAMILNIYLKYKLL